MQFFKMNVGPESDSISTDDRIEAIPVKRIFSKGIFKVFKVIVFDIILQTRILRTDRLRWFMHFMIFFGGSLLLFFHGCDEIISKNLLPSYSSTYHPYFSLRIIFGLMVIAGIIIAIIRRIKLRKTILFSKAADVYIITLIIIIVVTGFFLDSAKIVSEGVFDRMVVQYGFEYNEKELKSLKAFWSKEGGVVFKNYKGPFNDDLLKKGSKLNNESCAMCHAHPKTAFVSYGLAKVMRPVADSLNKSKADIWIYFIHVMACFIALAYLPFSKFFHVISNPFLLIVEALSYDEHDPATKDTRRALEFYACTNCGTCSKYCSVRPFYQMTNNKQILPAEKLKNFRALSLKKTFTSDELKEISEGAFICTDCHKCTLVCPTAIDLQDQWGTQKKIIDQKGFPQPNTWIKRKSPAQWSDEIDREEKWNEKSLSLPYQKLTLASSDTYSACIQCQTCTNVCPVVACNVSKEESIDITPQKIMNLLRMGLKDLAITTRMAWDCTTCYQCQENCPQGIKVTDILYELKNVAYNELKDHSHKRISDKTSDKDN